MDVLLENIPTIINILDKTSDETKLTSVMDSFKSLDMPVKMEIDTSLEFYEDNNLEVETLMIVFDKDVCMHVSKYFMEWYDVQTLYPRYDGGYTIKLIENGDRNIYKKFCQEKKWVGNDYYNNTPQKFTMEEQRLIDTLNSEIPKRWYEWIY